MSDFHLASSPRPPGAPPEGHRIKRKPVSGSNGFTNDAKHEVAASPSPGQSFLAPPEGPPPPYESLQLSPQQPSRPPLLTKASSNTVPDLALHEDHDDSNTLAPRPTVSRAVTDAPPSSQSTSPSGVQKAYGEARHFLGGLINRPTESNRHFTILRHSFGVVFYRGSTTSVTVSIFSDTPLPPDRTLWLQNKGWTGKTGMRAKALFRVNDDWLNVTPSVALHASQVGPVDERGWQRDVAKFRKKAPAKIRDRHQLRQTVMARIPVEAGDGYFQLVLCQGMKKKVLCGSPVFRLLSTSVDPSSIRGASLSTLPLEVGALVLSTYAQATARTALTPASAAVQNKLQTYHPSLTKQVAAEKAASMSKAKDKVESILDVGARGQDDQGLGFPDGQPNFDQGPVAPFPIDFKARGKAYFDVSQYAVQDSPIVNLTRVPDSILDRFHGYYICWTRLYQTDDKSKDRKTAWYPSILCIRNIDHSTTTRVNMSDIRKRTTTLRFLEDVQLSPEADVKIQARVMCFLRPEMPAPSASSEKELFEAREAAAEASFLADSCDTSYALTLLDNPAWAPELPELDSQKDNGQKFLDKTRDGYVAARTRIENPPLHWLGVRSATAGRMDQQVTVNGFYIVR